MRLAVAAATLIALSPTVAHADDVALDDRPLPRIDPRFQIKDLARDLADSGLQWQRTGAVFAGLGVIGLLTALVGVALAKDPGGYMMLFGGAAGAAETLLGAVLFGYGSIKRNDAVRLGWKGHE